MTGLISEGSIVEQWHTLVRDASANCKQKLDEELESYLVFALVRFTERKDLVNSFIAVEFLEGLGETGMKQYSQLRDIADKCLLFSGMFPKAFREKIVDISYYVNIGRTSYSQLGSLLQRKLSGLYSRISSCFISMTDVLHSMRELDGTPIMDEQEKYRFWVDHNSDYARQSLQRFFGVVPVNPRG